MPTKALPLLLAACILAPAGIASGTGDKNKKAPATNDCANLRAEIQKAAQNLASLRDATRKLREATARVEQERDQLAAKLAAAEKRGADCTKELADLKRHHTAALAKLKAELDTALNAGAALKAKQAETEKLLTKSQGEQQMLADELKAAWGRAKAAEVRNKELANLGREKADLVASLKELRAKSATELAKQRQALEKEIAEQKRSLETSTLQIDGLRKQLATAKAEAEKAKARPVPDTKKLEAELASLRRGSAELKAKLGAAQAQLAKEGTAKGEGEKKAAALQRELSNAKRAAEELKKRLDRDAAERASLEGKVAELEKKLAAPRPGGGSPKPAPAGSDLVAVIHFGEGCCSTERERENAIERVKAILRKSPETQFDIVGHTCSTGCAQANLCLSKCRARYVQDTLIIAGIKPRILDTYGLGEEQPVADNRKEDGRRKNRRVEIRIYRPGALPPGY